MKSIAKMIAGLVGMVLLLAVALLTWNYLRFMVFWAPTEEVAFESDPGITIRGTLIKPADEGTFPAVVLLHGSGPENRSGPGYRALTNVIVRSGVAVLLYDKRGVGESDGDFGSAEYSDFIADAVAAVNYLAERDDIDPRNIGLHGNSESGWLTPEIAHTTGRVAWVFNRVGPPLAWMDNVIWEVRNDSLADGVSEADIESVLAATRRRWEYYIAAAADPSLAMGPEREAINAELARLIEDIPAARPQVPEELAAYDAEAYAIRARRYAYDPRPFLESIDVPMIYTFAEDDINVPTVESVAFLESFREQYDKDIRIVVYEGVGHAMAGPTGLFSAGYIPAFVETLEDWYRAQAIN